MYRYRWMDSRSYHIKYSQNFIKSDKLASQIVNLANFNKNDLVIEIGPGKGSLTEFIVNSGAKVIAVEKDINLAENLNKIYKDENIEIINEDFLDFQLPNKTYKLIGNIPFALTSKIIRKVLFSQNPPEECYLIMQKEAALRLKGNDLLSLKLKLWFEITIIKNFKPEDFFPRPSVLPILLKIKKLEFPLISFEDKQDFENFLTYCFLNSKSGIRSSFRKIFTFKQLGVISQKINLKKKPSEVNLEKWITLFYEFKKSGIENNKKIVKDFAAKSILDSQGNKKIYRSRAKRI